MKKVLLMVTILSLFLTACSTSQQTLQIAGSSTVLPIVSQTAEMYQIFNPEVRVLVNGGGSGVGVNQVTQGTVAIGMSSRDLSEEELAANPQLTTHLIGKDAVVVAISSEVYEGGITELSLEQVRQIYAGIVENWAELGGPDKEILVIDKEKSRGTRHVFMDAVFGNQDADAPGADLVLGSNNEEQTAIVQSDAAIGMLSLAWLNDDVRAIAILTPTGVVEPSKETILSGDYPIARDLFLITNGVPGGVARNFIAFTKSSKGQEVVEELGYVGISQG